MVSPEGEWWMTSTDYSIDSQEPSWFVTDYPSPHKSPDSGTQLFKNDSGVEILASENKIQDQIVGFRPSSKQHGELKLSAIETLCANAAMV
jgi:hypothetical protein